MKRSTFFTNIYTLILIPRPVQAFDGSQIWISPAYPDFASTFENYQPAEFSWQQPLMGELFAEYVGGTSQPLKADLWIADYDTGIYKGRLLGKRSELECHRAIDETIRYAVGQDLTTVGSFTCTFNLSATLLSVTNKWIIAWNEVDVIYDGITGCVRSPAFYIYGDGFLVTSVSTSTSSTVLSTSSSNTSSTTSIPAQSSTPTLSTSTPGSRSDTFLTTSTLMTASLRLEPTSAGSGSSGGHGAVTSQSMSTAAKVGTAIGAVMGAIAFITAGWCLARKFRDKSKAEKSDVAAQSSEGETNDQSKVYPQQTAISASNTARPIFELGTE